MEPVAFCLNARCPTQRGADWTKLTGSRVAQALRPAAVAAAVAVVAARLRVHAVATAERQSALARRTRPVHTHVAGGTAVSAAATVVDVGKEVGAGTGAHGFVFTASRARGRDASGAGRAGHVATAAMGSARRGVGAEGAAKCFRKETRGRATSAFTNLSHKTGGTAGTAVADVIGQVPADAAAALKPGLAQSSVRQGHAQTVQAGLRRAAIADKNARVIAVGTPAGRAKKNGKSEQKQSISGHEWVSILAACAVLWVTNIPKRECPEVCLRRSHRAKGFQKISPAGPCFACRRSLAACLVVRVRLPNFPAPDWNARRLAVEVVQAIGPEIAGAVVHGLDASASVAHQTAGLTAVFEAKRMTDFVDCRTGFRWPGNDCPRRGNPVAPKPHSEETRRSVLRLPSDVRFYGARATAGSRCHSQEKRNESP